MKAKPANPPPIAPAYPPLAITLVFESREEVARFYSLMNHTTITGALEGPSSSGDKAARECREAIDDALRQRGEQPMTASLDAARAFQHVSKQLSHQ